MLQNSKQLLGHSIWMKLITNSEYRQFVEWVKDSTMRVRLAILADMSGITAADGKG
jgi:uncharacterized iron-regulated protein